MLLAKRYQAVGTPVVNAAGSGTSPDPIPLTYRIQYHNVRLGPDRADVRMRRVLPEIQKQCQKADLEPGLVTLWSGKSYVCE